jgi:hypothetical protein
MKLLSTEKFAVLARQNGWSLEYAEGFVKGERLRENGEVPSPYVLIGMDEHCIGFRAGYFVRSHPRTAHADMPPVASQRMPDRIHVL